jgi:2-phosphosulfolactate phosphatase
MTENSIDVCFSPALADHFQAFGDSIVVVVDILRASTTIVSALENGAKSVIPVSSIEKATELKKYGFPVAAERDGSILSFADFGNSAFAFQNGEVKGEKLVFTTTNGTVAIEKGKELGELVVGAFSNLSALAGWIAEQDRNVIILCSGWKNNFCLEDTLFAGALLEKLLQLKAYNIHCDSAFAAIDLWNVAKNDLLAYIEKATHRERLRVLGVDDVLEYSFTMDTSRVVPVLKDGELVDVLVK